MAGLHESIILFIKNYCKAFNEYGQDPKMAHKLYDFLDPDLEFIPYIRIAATIRGRDKFLEMEAAHPSTYEIITPEDIIVDDKRKIAVVLLNAKLVDSTSGKVLVEKKYFPAYCLVTDKNNALKIKKILFFEETLIPGSLDVGHVLARDESFRNLPYLSQNK